MEFLLEIFEDGRHEHVGNPFLGPCCQAGWDKLEKYYNKTGESCAYVAAVALVPTRKWEFFEKGVIWREGMLERQCKRCGKTSISRWIPILPIPRSESRTIRGKENRFKTWSRQHVKVPEVIYEYKRYCGDPVIEMDPDEPFDPREWWQETTQRKVYPNLSRIALDLLSIPAMSAEVERLFSSCKITITDRRNRIGIEAVEAIECLKSWLREDNIAWVDEDWTDRWIAEVEAETQNGKGKWM